MSSYDYVIVGAGPTGLSLASALIDNGFGVAVIEMSDTPGGSWNSRWADGYYFSENSPRVIRGRGSHMDFFRSIGLGESDFKDVYGGPLQTNAKIISFLLKRMTAGDVYHLAVRGVFGGLDDGLTLGEWLRASPLSGDAKDALRILSILICDVPDNTNAVDFFSTISSPVPSGIKQFTRPNKWHGIVTEKILSKENCGLFLGTRAERVIGDGVRADGVACVDVATNSRFAVRGANVVLCTQSDGLSEIASPGFADNWGPGLGAFSRDNHYNSFGFQLHFDEDVPYPKGWCWGCTGDWTVIVLPVSEWLETCSLDPVIKTVWSCCIIDTDAVSGRTGKSANAMNEREILDECVRQLRDGADIPPPAAVTLSEGLRNDGTRWVSKNTGFTRRGGGWLDMKGKADNLYALGCFTRPPRPHIADVGTAVDATKTFLLTYLPDTDGFHRASSGEAGAAALVAAAFVCVVAVRAMVKK